MVGDDVIEEMVDAGSWGWRSTTVTTTTQPAAGSVRSLRLTAC